MPKNKRQPNEKQQRFVDEYLVDLNATQAAIRAGYSANRASEIGYQLLHKTTVAAAVARAQAERSRRTGITADRVLRELARVAFCNPDDVINPNTAEVLPDATEDDKRCIAGVKVKYIPHKDYDKKGEPVIEQAIEREVKLCDKLKALDMLAKHLGMYDGVGGGKDSDDDKEQTGVALMPPVEPLTQPTDNPVDDVQTEQEGAPDDG